MSLADLPEGWTVWSDEQGRVVLAYRPDVFDGGEFPPPCLPTLYLTRGKRGRRPGDQRVGRSWHVTLYLEPEVDHEVGTFADRESAVAAAREFAAEFAAGGFDVRACYELPREDYLDELEALTGRAERSE